MYLTIGIYEILIVLNMKTRIVPTPTVRDDGTAGAVYTEAFE